MEALHSKCNISDISFLKRVQIKKALPKAIHLHYKISSTETKFKSSIFLFGNQLLNTSLSACYDFWDRAAMNVIQTLEDSSIADELTSEYAS